jgi:hypothetical protein
MNLVWHELVLCFFLQLNFLADIIFINSSPPK